MVRTLGALVGHEPQAEQLCASLQATQDEIAAIGRQLPRRPRVCFEEWDEPLIMGIGWVSEIIELAGGEDVFADRARASLARDRIVSPEEVLARRPELILGSWCGKRFVPDKVLARPGFAALGARLIEIKSADILAPGPTAIERGARQVQAALQSLFQDPTENP
jgi:iron complex transport system substrate-binding protein